MPPNDVNGLNCEGLMTSRFANVSFPYGDSVEQDAERSRRIPSGVDCDVIGVAGEHVGERDLVVDRRRITVRCIHAGAEVRTAGRLEADHAL